MDLKPLDEHDLEVQDIYAGWLDWLVGAAFVLTVATLVLYLTGALAPHVPLAALPELWHLPLAQYLDRAAAPTGWDWLALVGRGDYLNLAAIAFFAMITLICYLRVAPPLWRPGTRLQAGLAVAQVLVLLAAMSGLI